MATNIIAHMKSSPSTQLSNWRLLGTIPRRLTLMARIMFSSAGTLNRIDAFVDSRRPFSTTDPTDPTVMGKRISERVTNSLTKARQTTEQAVVSVGNHISSLFDLANENNVAATGSLCRVIGGGASINCSIDTDDSIAELLENQRRSIDLFVQKTQQFCMHHERMAADSLASFEEMKKSIAKIEKIAKNSHVLAINAQIESARLGDKGQAMSVVGSQMGTFSDEIQTVNENIKQSVCVVDKAMQQFREGASDMKNELDSFSSQVMNEVGKVETRSREISDSLARTLDEITSSNEKLMTHSQIALSELQFQDPLSQDLMRTAYDIQKLQSLIETGLCDDTDLADIDPAVGHDGTLERESGEVELF
ncbi:methyl-accepting chemotaxis protein [Neorhodopirellula pilleata]|uniref:Methyl-accepting chemotaxis protein 4 n=1 Tax=Neorhodopirellula pilleata TaxID=2714738 RepID=A0A5C6AVU0_9BACT|nr:methyl-accepting chemotaxis protein [Neorhodopirellula pilleata]TWU04073.1 Methyl-accepting chemotaxis protein 4 [Neorhodopirellula pilleata]